MTHRPVITSFLTGRCPQCREGKIFKHPGYNLLKFKQTFVHCPVCNVRYESEPGFFWGAMYFSYALNVGLTIIVGIVFFNIYEDPPLGPMVGTVLAISALGSPLMFRLSRLFMMYIASPYRKYKGRPVDKG